MGKLIAGVAVAASVAFGGPAAAEIRAVLVAVSAYTAPIPSLEGPPNDAAALRSRHLAHMRSPADASSSR